MDLGIADKTALVTGASTGIGRGIALALAAEGVKIAIVARRRNLLEEVASEVAAQGGTPAVVIECDLMRDDAPATIADAALAGLGSVDILVNNAGGSRKFSLDTAEEQWNEALTLNFTRQRQLTHKLLDQMMARKWGRIVNITGKSEPDGINGAFCAKAAMHSWAEGPVARSRQARHHRQLDSRPGASSASRSCATTRPNTASGSPSTRSRWASTASPRTSPTWSAFSPPTAAATSPAR